ncbi:NAD-dependent epimerase/dehydratase family protein [Vibrio cholerae]|uniref:NAD-dependent epimerase/dehydratase family protein n=1 Tax=Vibrio cholerae TaxID=666 RepID=UPI00372BAD2A
MSKKILVTGGAGAIGFQLCKALAERGDTVFLVDNYLKGNRDDELLELISKDNVHEVLLDLSNPSELDVLPDDVDYVYHLAAFNGTQNFYEKPFDVLKHSTIPTIHLLEKYKNSKTLKRFVYTGSSEAYASSVTRFNWEVPTAEDVPLGIDDVTNVRWSYGGSKLHGELATFAAAGQYDIPVTVIRYHNVYGPRMGDKHIVPDFLNRAKKGVYELYGYEDTRSFLYVSDAVLATIKCAESENTASEVVNVGGLPELTMLELGQKMMGLLGIKEEIDCYPSPKGSVKRRAPALDKLKRLTDYEQTIDLDVGLKETINYYFK